MLKAIGVMATILGVVTLSAEAQSATVTVTATMPGGTQQVSSPGAGQYGGMGGELGMNLSDGATPGGSEYGGVGGNAGGPCEHKKFKYSVKNGSWMDAGVDRSNKIASNSETNNTNPPIVIKYEYSQEHECINTLESQVQINIKDILVASGKYTASYKYKNIVTISTTIQPGSTYAWSLFPKMSGSIYSVDSHCDSCGMVFPETDGGLIRKAVGFHRDHN